VPGGGTRGTVVAREAQKPASEVADGPADESSRARAVKPGHLPVSEIAADRPAALSPFGDDQTFPLPPEDLTYTATVSP
jgi:hypothetical protein